MYGHVIIVYRNNVKSLRLTVAFTIYLNKAILSSGPTEHFLILTRSGSSKPYSTYYSFVTE